MSMPRVTRENAQDNTPYPLRCCAMLYDPVAAWIPLLPSVRPSVCPISVCISCSLSSLARPCSRTRFTMLYLCTTSTLAFILSLWAWAWM